MGERSDIPGDDALLCEKCGYVLDDLDPSTICPECATPIAASQPRLRKGSPWQQKRSIVSLVRAWFVVFFASKQCWNTLRIEKPSALSLMVWGLIVSVIPFSLTVIGFVVYETFGYGASDMFFYALMYIGIIDAVFIVVALIYSAIAVTRMKFWARHRGWRIDSTRAWTVVGHASTGLTMIPLLVFLGMLAGLTTFSLDPYGVVHGDSLKTIQVILGVLAYILVLTSIPAGLIVFEVLCSLGIRRVRYRNLHADEKTKPTPHQHSGPPTVVT